MTTVAKCTESVAKFQNLGHALNALSHFILKKQQHLGGTTIITPIL